MSLLTICRAAADEIGIDRPAIVAASAQPEAQKLYRYANKVGNALMKAYAWAPLRAEQTFTSISQEIQTNALPDDFDRFLPETFWNRSKRELLVGPVTEVEWQSRKAQAITQFDRPRFIHRGSDILVTPTLAFGDSMAFAYVKNTWAQSSAGAAQTKFLADDDTTVLDEELITYGVIFEFLSGDGQPAQIPLAQYRDRLKQLTKSDRPASGVLSAGDIFGRRGRHFGGAPDAGGGQEASGPSWNDMDANWEDIG